MKKVAIEIILILSGILFLITGLNIGAGGFSGDVLNQRDYVLILSGLLIVLSGISMIKTLILSKKKDSDSTPETNSSKSEPESEENDRSHKVNKNIWMTMILLLLFAYGFSYIGFYVSSFIFVFILTWMMFNWSKRELAKSLIFSVGLNVAFFFLFQFINVYFPENTLLF
ncbi:tripartite tricarboxylate transporter TctB family protein [Radiobacillus kanasensis]|uniref:tripartite tricarboxylate transporter TctB family protein n=1 Tax=Radiobacillus kanasensis TaxID=2844358 RepID=UPI001E29EF5E|nr:tripartite tricarboxylate transporter TctB family protein [Radiobacillus kanasensis]UFT98783.1 tripartite tricarboxylate transporter TctB family protein [Radiobacillus kanasensis]